METPSEGPEARLPLLARGLAHEIRNPLSTMAINLALLQEDWEKAGAARNPTEPELTPREDRSLRRIRTLQREVHRLEGILDEFQAYVRGADVNRRPHDLSKLVCNLLDFVEPENEEAGIRAHVELPPGLPLVLVDESAIQQAVLNLLVNARQAMPKGGELLVRARRVGNQVELSITDTGVGMRPEGVERCFEEYWSDKKGGTGLGLSTTRRIVEEHGGSIHVVSEEGRGTSFSVTLPLAVELPRSRSRPAGDGGGEPSTEASPRPHGEEGS